jgi:uncharacterized protein YndB with AHSA1/START domain
MAKARRSFEGSSTCSAPAATVWEAWSSPSDWPGGPIDSVTIDGAFAEGAKIKARVKGGPPTTTTVTRLEPPRFWVCVSTFPGVLFTYEHEINDATDGSGGTVLIERVIMTGPLAGIAARLLGRGLEKTFVQTTGRVAELAESRLAN